MPRDIDRILDAWFAEGPSVAADRVVGAALAQSELIPQARPMRRRGDRRRPVWLLLAATVAIAMTLVGIGFAAGIFRIERPRPGPIESPAVITSPSPSESVRSIPPEWHTYTSERNGYEIAIPTNWTASESNGATYFSSDGHVVLLVSVGSRAGWVTVCSGEPCQIVMVDGIDELDAIVMTVAAPSGRIPEQTVDIALDGWPARMQGPAPDQFLDGPPANVNVFGMLDGRPVVLRFNYSWRAQDIPTAMQSAVIESFALLRD